MPAAAPPSRRHLAKVLSEAVPVVNEHADRLEYLKTRQDEHARTLAALTAAQSTYLVKDQSWYRRLLWLCGW